jgi:hypothetical protein
LGTKFNPFKTMKLIVTLTMVFTTTLLFGQAKTERPRTEFSIDLSENNLSLKPGESREVTVLLMRSKGYTKYKATMGFMSVLPSGISVTFAPQEGELDSAKATISVATTVTPGVYQIVPSATLSKTKKGSVLKLTVQ